MAEGAIQSAAPAPASAEPAGSGPGDFARMIGEPGKAQDKLVKPAKAAKLGVSRAGHTGVGEGDESAPDAIEKLVEGKPEKAKKEPKAAPKGDDEPAEGEGAKKAPKPAPEPAKEPEEAPKPEELDLEAYLKELGAEQEDGTILFAGRKFRDKDHIQQSLKTLFGMHKAVSQRDAQNRAERADLEKAIEVERTANQAGIKRATEWKDYASSLEARIKELESRGAASPAGPMATAGAASSAGGTSDQAAILSQADLAQYQALSEQDPLAAANFFASRIQAASNARAEALFQAKIREQQEQQARETQQAQQHTQAAVNAFKQVQAARNLDGGDLFPELRDPEAAGEIFQLWEAGGQQPSTQAVVSVIGLYRVMRDARTQRQSLEDVVSQIPDETPPAPAAQPHVVDEGHNLPTGGGKKNVPDFFRDIAKENPRSRNLSKARLRLGLQN